MVTATSPLLLSSLTYIRQYVDDIILYFQYSVYHFSLFPATESPYLRVLKVLSILQTKECVLSHLREAFFLYRKAISCKIKIGPPDQLLICNATKKAGELQNSSPTSHFLFILFLICRYVLMLKLILPILSLPIQITLTSSPSVRTSSTRLIRSFAILEI